MDETMRQPVRAMRWNERIRLVIGVFNRSAVAVLGAAAVGSAFRQPGADAAPAPACPGRHPADLARLRPGAAPARARARRADRAGGRMSELDPAALDLVGLAAVTTAVLVALYRLRHRPPSVLLGRPRRGGRGRRRSAPRSPRRPRAPRPRGTAPPPGRSPRRRSSAASGSPPAGSRGPACARPARRPRPGRGHGRSPSRSPGSSRARNAGTGGPRCSPSSGRRASSRADEVERPRHPAPAAAGEDEQHVVAHRRLHPVEEGAGQVGMAPLAAAGVLVEAPEGVPVLGLERVAGQRDDLAAEGLRAARAPCGSPCACARRGRRGSPRSRHSRGSASGTAGWCGRGGRPPRPRRAPRRCRR